jgi:hypothetical protein
MPVDHIRYDLLTQKALRGVLRTVLSDAAKNGLPGEHHFFVTFDTRADGVRLSQRMRGQYPEEMTIVLQHQFWDLTVGEEAFEVGLSFGGVPEKLSIPFAAVKGFFDPSVQFGLQFEQINQTAQDETASSPAPPAKKKSDASAKAGNKPSRAAPAAAAAPTSVNPGSPDAGQPPDPESNRGEVVSLDLFRKK